MSASRTRSALRAVANTANRGAALSRRAAPNNPYVLNEVAVARTALSLRAERRFSSFTPNALVNAENALKDLDLKLAQEQECDDEVANCHKAVHELCKCDM